MVSNRVFVRDAKLHQLPPYISWDYIAFNDSATIINGWSQNSPTKSKKINTSVEKDHSQSDDENFLRTSDPPPWWSELTNFKTIDGTKNQLNAQITTITKSEDNIKSFETSNKPANVTDGGGCNETLLGV